jgi:hypothetical protein
MLKYASSPSSNGSLAVLPQVIEPTERYRLSSTTDRGNSCLIGIPAMTPMYGKTVMPVHTLQWNGRVTMFVSRSVYRRLLALLE